MSKIKEIECLKRLQNRKGGADELLEFLVSENFIDTHKAKSIKTSPEAFKELHECLKSLHDANKFQLLEYEWQVLPIERIKITIVTDRIHREFVHNF